MKDGKGRKGKKKEGRERRKDGWYREEKKGTVGCTEGGMNVRGGATGEERSRGAKGGEKEKNRIEGVRWREGGRTDGVE